MVVDYIVSRFLYILKLKIAAWYDSTAAEYAKQDEENSKANLDIKNMVKSLTSFSKNILCLDLGCGAGRYFPFIEGETVRVDLSTKMLKSKSYQSRYIPSSLFKGIL
ncbi:MAG: hypothetical protein QXF61_09570 [Nitrososphaeria archaeon]